MSRHYIFIITDANRTFLAAGYCQDLALYAFELQQASSSFRTKTLKCSRMVYAEIFDSKEAALRHKQEIESYTKMQKERLIRKNNPNWLGITNYNINTMNGNKKVVVFA